MRIPFMQKRSNSNIGIVVSSDDCICVPGYTSLDQCPEVLTGCRRIAELIGSITIYLMSNTEQGDVRIVNELSKMIDISDVLLYHCIK